MPVEEKSLLLQFQEFYLQNLINLVPIEKRAKALQLTEEYKQSVRALSSVTPGSNRERYAGIQYVIDAIRLYLSDVDKPLTEDEIIEGVVGSGFRADRPSRTRGDIKKSLGMYLTGQAAPKREIRRVGNLIGLGEWADDKFSP